MAEKTFPQTLKKTDKGSCYYKIARLVSAPSRGLDSCPGRSAPVAQLDRAPDYESGGREFESSPVRHFFFIASAPPPGAAFFIEVCNSAGARMKRAQSWGAKRALFCVRSIGTGETLFGDDDPFAIDKLFCLAGIASI
jgi:hypothetical protein